MIRYIPMGHHTSLISNQAIAIRDDTVLFANLTNLFESDQYRATGVPYTAYNADGQLWNIIAFYSVNSINAGNICKFVALTPNTLVPGTTVEVNSNNVHQYFYKIWRLKK